MVETESRGYIECNLTSVLLEGMNVCAKTCGAESISGNVGVGEFASA